MKKKATNLNFTNTAKYNQLFAEYAGAEVEFLQLSVHKLFAEQAAKTPRAIAVVASPHCSPILEDKQNLTYQELNCKANQVSKYLKTQYQFEFDKSSPLIGLCVDRDLSMAVGILGILKAGAAYLPLDPTYPQERLQFMLENSGVRVLVTTQKLLAKFPELCQVTQGVQFVFLDREWDEISCQCDRNPKTETSLERLAYVIYTSGSTGKPKGVAMSHRALSNLLSWQRENPLNNKSFIPG